MDHKNSHSASYAAAGVDITAGYRAVELMKKHVARTRNEGCLDDVGGFGGCFGLPIAGMEEPVLVSGTDGCGTKVKLAILMDKHDTIGIDAVAMCVNDIICVGAKPLFFLDYIACGKNVPEKIAEIVSGVAEGCVQSGAALIGGETAEHPGMMPVEDYAQIVEAIHSVLEKTPPELAADIADRGMVLTGGGSLLQGLEELIESRTGINTMTAEDPMTAVAIGTGKFIEFLAGDR